VKGSITFFGKIFAPLDFGSLTPKLLVAFMLIISALPGLAIWTYELKIGEERDRIVSRRCDVEVAIPYLDNYPILGRNLQDKYYNQIDGFNFPQVCVDKIFDFVYEDEIEDILRGKEYRIVFAKSKDGYKAFYNVRPIIDSFAIEANRSRTAIYGFSAPIIQNIDFLYYQVPLYKGPSGKWIETKLRKQLPEEEATRTTIEWMIDLLEEQRRQKMGPFYILDSTRLTKRLEILSASPDIRRDLRTCVYNSYSIITIRNFLKSLRYQAVSQLRDDEPGEINLVELRRNLGERFFSFYLNNSPQTIEQQYGVDKIAAKLARYRALFLAGQHDRFLEEMRSDEGVTGLFTNEWIKKEIYGMKFVIYAARINYFEDIGLPPEVMEALDHMPDCIEKQVNQRLLLSHWPERFRSKLDSLETSIKSQTAKIPDPEREQMEYLLEISKVQEKIFSNDPRTLESGESEARTRIGRMVTGEDPYMMNIFTLRDLMAFSRYRLAKLLRNPAYLIQSLEAYWELSKSTRIPFLDNFQSVVEDAKGNREVYGVDEAMVTYLDKIGGLLTVIPDSGPIPDNIRQEIDNQMAEVRQAIIGG